MAFGFSGSQGVGKSTLVAQMRLIRGFPLVGSKVREVATSLGINLSAGFSLPFDQRMDFQEAVLKEQCKAWDEHNTFWSDRTPLDMAAYLLNDARGGELTAEQQVRVLTYVGDCLEATERHFHFITVVPPGIPYVEEPGRPPRSEVEQMKIHTTIVGLANQLSPRMFLHFLPPALTNIDDRVQDVKLAYNEFVEEYRANTKGRNTLH